MNARKIREDLGRARTCVQRRDLPRAVYLFCICLKDLGTQAAPMDLRGDFRTALADICADPVFKKSFAQPLSFQPGKERELLVILNKFYKQVMGHEDEEDYQSTLQRKLQLDRCLNDGKAFIAQARYSEADDCFSKALSFYKDEIAIFGMMAKAMMEASQFVRALGYVRKGLQHQPENVDLRKLGDECIALRNKSGK